MALTPAERMKRYREKLKLDPQKYEEHKKKHAAKVKTKSKKISELPEDEKIKLRKKWREHKRNQKKNKLLKPENINIKNHQSSETNSKLATRKRQNKRNKLVRRYNNALKRIQVLTTALQTSRKNLYRYKKATSTQIKKLEETVDKMKAREEILESTMKATYKKCKTYNEKNALKALTENEKTKTAKKKIYISKLLGLKSMARRRMKQIKNNVICKDIQTFYNRDDISKSTAGKKECRTSQKQKEQIRYLTDTLCNIYQIYRAEGGTRSFSTFYKYKPFNVLSPNVQKRETCLCIKHSNFEHVLNTLRKAEVLSKYKRVEDIFTQLTCDMKSKKCMYGDCKQCSTKKLDYELKDGQRNKNIEWEQWENTIHKYKKTENGKEKNITTKKMQKQTKTGTVGSLIQIFEERLKAFKKHYYNWKHQTREFRKCVSELKKYECLIICDYSENYCCKMAEEIQSMHFGAAKQQFTLHTGMIYWAEGSQSFCSISDNNSHDPAAIWAHLLPVIRLAKECNPSITVIHFFSDGPSTQYRQKKNFYLHNLFAFKLGLDYSTWSFSESGHGKSVADGIGGTTKRTLDKQVAYGHDIVSGSQAFELLSRCMKIIKCFYITSSDIDNIRKLVPNILTPVTGTMQIHQVIVSSPGAIHYRWLSCFCGIKRGLCNCFELRNHTFENNATQTGLNCATPTNKITVEAEINSTQSNRRRNSVTASNKIAITVSTTQNPCTDITNLQDLDGIEIYEPNEPLGTGFDEKDLSFNLTELPIHFFDDMKMDDVAEDFNIIDLTAKTSGEEDCVSNYNLIKRKQDDTCKIQTKRVIGTLQENVSNIDSNISLKRKRTSISIRNVVSRKLQCNLCKIQKPFQTMSKCMGCANFYCSNCNGSNLPNPNHYDDYICDVCFGE